MDWTTTLLLVMLGAVGIFQLLLVLGAPLGTYAWGGQYKGTLPLKYRISSVCSLLIIAGFMTIILQRAGIIGPYPQVVSDVGLWIFVAYTGLAVVMNAISRSRAERIWAPYSLIMLLLTVPLL